MTLRPLSIPVLLCGLYGCAAFAAKDDYRDYRAVRLARGQEAQLLAMQRYVARHPDGRWHAEVQTQRTRREREIFERGKSSRSGLSLYLAAFPNGMFEAQARARVSAIELIEQRKREEAARAASLQAERDKRDEELSRTWITRFAGYWIKTLVGLEDWGEPIAEVAQHNPEFSRAFGRPPRPRCTEQECVKYYESSFGVRVPGATRLEREVQLILRLRLEQGRLQRAELLFPRRGFSRWKELEAREAVVDGDALARGAAVAFALSRLEPLLESIAPGRKPLRGYTPREIAKLQLDPTGERVDTTAEDPSAPSNRIQGSAPAEPPSAESTQPIGGMLKPVKPEQAPDMELTPVGVGRDGRAQRESDAPAQAPAPSENAAGDTMELAPVVVPRAPGASPGASVAAAAAPPEPTAPAAPPTSQERDPGAVRAYSVEGGLRVVLFAAPSDSPAPAYDGIVVEQASAIPRH